MLKQALLADALLVAERRHQTRWRGCRRICSACRRT
ncbi:hypothetical protein DUNSADRAFT_14507 [Dunaliella salina]|uniref:Uncharacterized protein n=1 Tax=Dunaliella salina TaxID=3046 RepID=A0ABQ7G7C0_DUNSA|nr:hypothetical protein DUNSADRAFT_14507 [Dunaliella salina]|eukprot:KAF5830504.1 hypothetical protein DUNSADRAFT_14507 [Dunaliella salina]